MRRHRPLTPRPVAAAAALLLGSILHAEETETKAAPDLALESIQADRLVSHIEVLASDDMEGRQAGTDGGGVAAAYLIRHLENLGLEPKGTRGFRQPFQRRSKKLNNLVALLPGNDPELANEYVVIGAHYDHLGLRGKKIFNGADDNASGCAAVLEMTRALKKDRPRRSVLVMFFDGEETGLVGSKHFVRKPTVPRDKIVAMINLDMVSRGETGDVRIVGTTESSRLKQIVESHAQTAELELHYDYERKWRNASDHGSFRDAEIPFLYFGVVDHEDYHKPTDTADLVNDDKTERITRLAFLTAREIANADDRPKFEPTKR